MAEMTVSNKRENTHQFQHALYMGRFRTPLLDCHQLSYREQRPGVCRLADLATVARRPSCHASIRGIISQETQALLATLYCMYLALPARLFDLYRGT